MLITSGLQGEYSIIINTNAVLRTSIDNIVSTILKIGVFEESEWMSK